MAAYRREYDVAYRYGISSEQLGEMSDEQGGLCAICRALPAKCIDHDHETGEIRGLLCPSCNTGLGYFKDDPTLLRSAIEYLARPRSGLVVRRVRVGYQAGERHYRATLTAEQVAEIRELLAAGHTGAELAPRFGVGRSTISRIKMRKERFAA